MTDLVRERNLLSNLSRCLLETMRSASFIPGSPGSPAPAGASSDMMNDLETRVTPSSSLTAAILALLGFFSVDGRDADNLARLDVEINDLLDDLLGFGMVDGTRGGGDSRHHGRISTVARRNSNPANALLERTAALVPPTLDPTHTVLSHRRYSVCISDLKCVLNVDGMARHFASLPIDQKQPYLASATSRQGGGIDYLTIKPRNSKGKRDSALDDWIKVCTFAVRQWRRPCKTGYMLTRVSTADSYPSTADGWANVAAVGEGSRRD